MKRNYRLTHSNDFKRVRNTGKSFAHPLVVIVVAEGHVDNVRAGIVATKAVGGAVERNTIKRRLKEIITPLLPGFTANVDLIIIARDPALKASYSDLQSAILGLLGKAGLVVSNDYDS